MNKVHEFINGILLTIVLIALFSLPVIVNLNLIPLLKQPTVEQATVSNQNELKVLGSEDDNDIFKAYIQNISFTSNIEVSSAEVNGSTMLYIFKINPTDKRVSHIEINNLKNTKLSTKNINVTLLDDYGIEPGKKYTISINDKKLIKTSLLEDNTITYDLAPNDSTSISIDMEDLVKSSAPSSLKVYIEAFNVDR